MMAEEPGTLDVFVSPIGRHLAFPAIQTSASPGHHTQHHSKKSITLEILMDNPTSKQLSSETHPFFQDMKPLSTELKSFDDQVLVIEGDIFERCAL